MKQPIHKIRIPDELAERVRGFHPQLKRKLKASLKIILSNPDEGKALREELAGLRSFRVGQFRVIYRVEKKIVEVVAIGPREKIYEETFLILKKEKRR